MNIKFLDDALSELYETGKTSDKKYKKICKNKKLVDGYIKAVGIMYRVDTTEDLVPISYLHYEKLKYDSIGINVPPVSETNVPLIAE